jgi:hypothetical protein
MDIYLNVFCLQATFTFILLISIRQFSFDDNKACGEWFPKN